MISQWQMSGPSFALILLRQIFFVLSVLCEANHDLENFSRHFESSIYICIHDDVMDQNTFRITVHLCGEKADVQSFDDFFVVSWTWLWMNSGVVGDSRRNFAHVTLLYFCYHRDGYASINLFIEKLMLQQTNCDEIRFKPVIRSQKIFWMYLPQCFFDGGLAFI